MKRRLFLCLIFIVAVSPPAMTQKNSANQGASLMHIETTVEQLDKRVGKIEATVEQLDKRVGKIEATVEQLDRRVARIEDYMSRIDGRLDSIIMWVVSLIAASFISLFVLILQIRTQLRELNAKFGSLQKDVGVLNEKVDKLEKRVDGVERRTGAQLNQIRKALGKQLSMDFDDEL